MPPAATSSLRGADFRATVRNAAPWMVTAGVAVPAHQWLEMLRARLRRSSMPAYRPMLPVRSLAYLAMDYYETTADTRARGGRHIRVQIHFVSGRCSHRAPAPSRRQRHGTYNQSETAVPTTDLDVTAHLPRVSARQHLNQLNSCPNGSTRMLTAASTHQRITLIAMVATTETASISFHGKNTRVVVRVRPPGHGIDAPRPGPIRWA